MVVAICPGLLSGRRDLPRSALICSSVVAIRIPVAVAMCILVLAICPDLPWSDLLACALLSFALICLLAIVIYLDRARLGLSFCSVLKGMLFGRDFEKLDRRTQ